MNDLEEATTQTKPRPVGVAETQLADFMEEVRGVEGYERWRPFYDKMFDEQGNVVGEKLIGWTKADVWVSGVDVDGKTPTWSIWRPDPDNLGGYDSEDYDEFEEFAFAVFEEFEFVNA